MYSRLPDSLAGFQKSLTVGQGCLLLLVLREHLKVCLLTYPVTSFFYLLGQCFTRLVIYLPTQLRIQLLIYFPSQKFTYPVNNLLTRDNFLLTQSLYYLPSQSFTYPLNRVSSYLFTFLVKNVLSQSLINLPSQCFTYLLK